MKLGEAWKSFSEKITPYNFTKQALINKTLSDRQGSFGNQFWFFDKGGNDHYFDWSGQESSLNAYNECPPVAAIINRKAQARVNGKTWVLNSKGKEATGDAANKIRRLMANPNKMQSGKVFKAQAYTYMQLYGYAVILLDRPFGYAAIDCENMWVIPNWMCEIEESETIFYQNTGSLIKRVKVKFKGRETYLPIDNIFILKDFRISCSSVFLPESRLKPMKMPVNNIIGSFESRNSIINSRGPNYVVSNKAKDAIGTSPMTPDEKEETQTAFATKYGLRKGQSRAIITSASIDVTSIGFNVAEMQLHEEVTESAKEICSGYGFPGFLLGLSDATFNNQKEAEKGLYQNTIIPEAESETEQWETLFGCAELNLKLNEDFSHVASLQQDAETKAKGRKAMNDALLIEWRNGMITLDMWLVKNGEDPMPQDDGRGKLYFPEYVKLYGDPNKTIAAGADQTGQDGTGQASQNQGKG